jgi:DNA polymerase III sliding clamp (beta) subunit (PCNA family)
MEGMIRLNLRSDSEKAAADNLPNIPEKQPESQEINSKRLNRILKKAAHKASSEYGQSKSGIFSK